MLWRQEEIRESVFCREIISVLKDLSNSKSASAQLLFFFRMVFSPIQYLMIQKGGIKSPAKTSAYFKKAVSKVEITT